jgi:hypothetical protein
MRGEPWRKSTTFLNFGVDLSEIGQHRCLWAARGFCLRTAVPHLRLQGRAPNGKWWTKVAEPYPPKLCNDLVTACVNSHIASRACDFTSLIEGNVRV